VSNHHPVTSAQFLVEPSKRLKYALVAAHGLALSACLISALPWPGKTLLGLILSVHLYLDVREIDARHDAIRCHEGSGLHINDEPVLVLPSTVVTPLAIWLHFQPQGTRKKTLLIVNDAMPEHEFRQLIVKLKISAT